MSGENTIPRATARAFPAVLEKTRDLSGQEVAIAAIRVSLLQTHELQSQSIGPFRQAEICKHDVRIHDEPHPRLENMI